MSVYGQTVTIDEPNEDDRTEKWVIIISTVGLVLAVSGCSSDYIMTTKDGRMILINGEPGIDDDTGLMSYHGQQGNTM